MSIDAKTQRALRRSRANAIDPGAGPQEAWRAIDEANRIFGADGWSRELIEMRCAATREREGLIITAYVAKVRVSLNLDTGQSFRDAQGCGEGKASTPFEAHSQGLKAAELDATLRALASFGRPFGLLALAGPNRARPASRPRSPSGKNLERRAPEDDDEAVTDSGKSTTADVSDADGDRTETTAHARPGGQGHQPPSGGPAHLADPHEKQEKAPVEPAGAATGKITPPSATSAQEQPTKESRLVHARDLVPDLTDGSGLMLPKQRRVRAPAHLAHVRCVPCLICGRQPCDAHHLRFMQPRAMAKKVSDEFTVPLCRRHHDLVHRDPDEPEWWAVQGVDPVEIARDLWVESGGGQTGAN